MSLSCPCRSQAQRQLAQILQNDFWRSRASLSTAPPLIYISQCTGESSVHTPFEGSSNRSSFAPPHRAKSWVRSLYSSNVCKTTARSLAISTQSPNDPVSLEAKISFSPPSFSPIVPRSTLTTPPSTSTTMLIADVSKGSSKDVGSARSVGVLKDSVSGKLVDQEQRATLHRRSQS